MNSQMREHGFVELAWSERQATLVSVGLIIMYLIYAGFFIFQTSVVLENERYFVLWDDMMISMKYAKNLATGHGLVYNPGELPVEGYSNFLWVLYMALLHLLPVSAAKLSLAVQITGAIMTVLTLLMVKPFCEEITGSDAMSYLVATFSTALYYPLHYWSLKGCETSFCGLLLMFAAWKALRCIRLNTSPVPCYVALGIGTWVRPDMVVPFAGVLMYMMLDAPRKNLHAIITGVGILIVVSAVQYGFRWFYFGELFPNTYYLKLTGCPMLPRLARGFAVTCHTVWIAYPFAFLLPWMIVFLRSWKAGRLPAYVILLQILYSTYVGGDISEAFGLPNRFVIIAMPLFFVLCGCMVATGYRQLWRLLPQTALSCKKVLAVSTILLVLAWQLRLNSGGTANEWMNLASTVLVGPAAERSLTRADILRAKIVQTFTLPDASFAIVRAGTTPYFAEREALDLLGKVDKGIARMDVNEKVCNPSLHGHSTTAKLFGYFYPGHMKWDYGYSIGARRPDVVLDYWFDTKQEIMAWLGDYEERRFSFLQSSVYFRRDSSKIRWNLLKSCSVPVSVAN